jgi:hypothetical protein
VFVCKTDVVVCSTVAGYMGCGVALAYSLNEVHVVKHCERVGARGATHHGNEDEFTVQPLTDVQGRGAEIDRS